MIQTRLYLATRSERNVLQDCFRLGLQENQEAGWEDRSAIQGTNPGLAELIQALKGIQDASS